MHLRKFNTSCGQTLPLKQYSRQKLVKEVHLSILRMSGLVGSKRSESLQILKTRSSKALENWSFAHASGESSFDSEDSSFKSPRFNNEPDLQSILCLKVSWQADLLSLF